MSEVRETILHLVVIVSILIAFLCVMFYPISSYSQSRWEEYVNENFNDPYSLKMRNVRNPIIYLDSMHSNEERMGVGYYETDPRVLDYKYDKRTFAECGYNFVDQNKSLPSLVYMSCKSKAVFHLRVYRPNLIYIEYIKHPYAGYTMFCN